MRRNSTAAKIALTVSIAPLLTGCMPSMPVAADYGMSKERMWYTPTYATVNPRSTRVRAERLNSNHFLLDLPAFEFVAAEQQGRDWCWAACIQMVLRYNGVAAEQRAIVERIKGKVREEGDDAGSVLDMVRGLWGPGRTTYVSNGISNWMVADLTFDSPVLLLLRGEETDDIGHVVVLYGMTFSMGPRGEVICHFLHLYDPLEETPEEVDAAELRARVSGMVHFRRYQ